MKRTVTVLVTLLVVLLLVSTPASALALDDVTPSTSDPVETGLDSDETLIEDDATTAPTSDDASAQESADEDTATHTNETDRSSDVLQTDGGDTNGSSERLADTETESLANDSAINDTTEAVADSADETTSTVSDPVEDNVTDPVVTATATANTSVELNSTPSTVLGELRLANGTTVGIGTDLNATVDPSSLRSATANTSPESAPFAANDTTRSNETAGDDEADEGGPVSTREAGAGIAAGTGLTGAALLARRIGTTAAMTPASGGSAGSLLSTALSVIRYWGLRTLALLGYQRFNDDDPLEHEARNGIYEYIRSAPGSYMTEISEETGVPLQTARYHLRILEFESLVSRRTIRGRRRYVPIGTESPELEAALNDESTAAVLYALADRGSNSVSGLADHLDRDPSTISHHLDRLADDGLVERERDGRAVVNRLPVEIEPLVDAHREIDADVEPGRETAVSGRTD